ncbi:MAG: nucleotidyltransferase domain-containing protein [Acidobacteria bacterium]|nr:nucleotidyltransferase domain-containing protein [Acidobacteriota bacterium]
MTGAADRPDRRPPATAPRREPALDDDERRWLEGYVERLRATPGALVERVVVYGSKARGDAGRESDVDVLVLVLDAPDSVTTAQDLVYSDVDKSYRVNHSVLVRTTAQWNEGLEMELSFPRNVEAEGIEVHPARRPVPHEGGPRPARGVGHRRPRAVVAARVAGLVPDLHVREGRVHRSPGRLREQGGDPGRLVWGRDRGSSPAWCVSPVLRRRHAFAFSWRAITSIHVMCVHRRHATVSRSEIRKSRTFCLAHSGQSPWSPSFSARSTCRAGGALRFLGI